MQNTLPKLYREMTRAYEASRRALRDVHDNGTPVETFIAADAKFFAAERAFDAAKQAAQTRLAARGA